MLDNKKLLYYVSAFLLAIVFIFMIFPAWKEYDWWFGDYYKVSVYGTICYYDSISLLAMIFSGTALLGIGAVVLIDFMGMNDNLIIFGIDLVKIAVVFCALLALAGGVLYFLTPISTGFSYGIGTILCGISASLAGLVLSYASYKNYF